MAMLSFSHFRALRALAEGKKENEAIAMIEAGME
jgi:hypothetical protein